MIIDKKPCFTGKGYDITLIKGEKKLSIIYARVLDLYMIIEDGKRFEYQEAREIDFNILSSDGEVYRLFDNLYNDILNKNPYGIKKKKKDDSFLKNSYDKLVDNNRIMWVSDDGIYEQMDRFYIEKMDDSYKIVFIRNELPLDFGFKNPSGISVRIRNSGSRYHPFNMVFMRLYNELQDVESKSIDEKVFIKK